MKYAIDGQTLTSIGEAIREKTGKPEQITPVQMPDEIRGIQGGTEPPSVGFVPSTWDDEGYVTNGTWYGTIVPDYAFYSFRGAPWKFADIAFADNVTRIGKYAFQACTSLALTSLPDSITTIDSYGFGVCTSLSVLDLPKGLTSIGTYAFNECTGLTSVTFHSTLQSIPSTAFNKCTNIAQIRVPWPEDQVSGAPWGATYASIIYDYTEG